MSNLARTYIRQKKWKEAEVLALEVVDLRQDSLGPNHILTLCGKTNLVRVYTGQERWDEAETLALQVLEKKKRVAGGNHPKTMISMCQLAQIWRSRNRHEEALNLMSQVVELSQASLDPNHPTTLDRKRKLDEWLSEADRALPVRTNKEARTSPCSYHTTPSTGNNITASPPVAGSTQDSDCATKHILLSLMRQIQSRRKTMLSAFERQLASNNFKYGDSDRHIRLRMDLLLEYKVDEECLKIL